MNGMDEVTRRTFMRRVEVLQAMYIGATYTDAQIDALERTAKTEERRRIVGLVRQWKKEMRA